MPADGLLSSLFVSIVEAARELAPSSPLFVSTPVVISPVLCSVAHFPLPPLEVAAGFDEEALNASEQLKIARLRLRLGSLLAVPLASSDILFAKSFSLREELDLREGIGVLGIVIMVWSF